MKYIELIKNLRLSGKCTLVLLVLIFFLTMTTFIVNEYESLTNENSTVIKILLSPAAAWNSGQSTMQQNATRFLLINIENNKKNNSDGRVPRHVPNNTIQSQRGYYYEEQQPVVVRSESSLPVLGSGQDEDENAGVPQADDNEGPFYSYDNDDEADDYTNLGKKSYGQNEKPLEYEEEYSEGGRSAQNQQFVRSQWNYSPWSYISRNSEEIKQRGSAPKRPAMASTQSPYASYDDEPMEYDYPMGFVHRKTSNSQKTSYISDMQAQQQQQQQQHKSTPMYERISAHQQLQLQQKAQPQQQQRPPAAAVENNESTLLSVAKGLKTIWEIYQAFSTAWNTIAEHRQRQDNAIKEKSKQQKQQQLQLKQQQQLQQRTRLRINSKKPPRFGNDNTTAIAVDVVENFPTNEKSTTSKPTKNTKLRKSKGTTTTTTTTTTTRLPQVLSSSTPKSIVEPRHGTEGDREWDEREKRASDGNKDTSSVGEGRYIKGDPLKGYYDFVITEGSYKFWAVFQTGTALLIIYSVFAAIYYSKVNPLVSDYDYTDYLGGARSLSSGDVDFVDDEDDHRAKPAESWYTDLLPRAGHSLQFILEAIDKFPADHESYTRSGPDKEESMEYTTNSA